MLNYEFLERRKFTKIIVLIDEINDNRFIALPKKVMS
jgi:hypothetical protein